MTAPGALTGCGLARGLASWDCSLQGDPGEGPDLSPKDPGLQTAAFSGFLPGSSGSEAAFLRQDGGACVGSGERCRPEGWPVCVADSAADPGCPNAFVSSCRIEPPRS